MEERRQEHKKTKIKKMPHKQKFNIKLIKYAT